MYLLYLHIYIHNYILAHARACASRLLVDFLDAQFINHVI